MRWSDGTFVDYQYWNQGEPNNAGVSGESCTSMYKSGKWNDAHCQAIAPIVCKYDKNQKPFTTPKPWAGNCPPGWIRTPAMCYKFFPDRTSGSVGLTWAQAKAACHAIPGAVKPDLASIPDHNVQVALVAGMLELSSADQGRAFWIGLSDADRERRFRWTDQSEYAYANWVRGEPNGNWFHDEDCVEMYTSPSLAGQWNDASCALKRGHICQMLPALTYPTPAPSTGCAANYTRAGPHCYRVCPPSSVPS